MLPLLLLLLCLLFLAHSGVMRQVGAIDGKGSGGETVRGSHWRVPEYYETEAAAAAACADWRQ